MRRDARSRKQDGKPELPIQRIAQRGESRALIWAVVHRRCHGPKLELLENRTGLYPVAEFGSAIGHLHETVTKPLAAAPWLELSDSRRVLIDHLVPISVRCHNIHILIGAPIHLSDEPSVKSFSRPGIKGWSIH
jgi:hypothetical protein